MSIRHDFLRRLHDPRGQEAESGWAGHSLEGSITRALLIAMAAWQGVMVLATFSSLGWATSGVLVAMSHGVAIGVALAVLRFGRGHLLLILGAWTLFVLDWAVAPTPESAVLFAACWMCNLTSTFPAVLLRGRVSWCVPLGATVAVPVLMVLVRPDWASVPLVAAVPVTLVAITIATRIGLSYLRDYTRQVDAEARALEAQTASLTTRKAATYQAAEDARVLHDTAINTLGAIATGGAAIDDAEAVRQRCLADIAALESLRSDDDRAVRPGLRDAIRPTGIRVRYVGLSEAAIADTETRLPPQVIQALSRAAAEAVQNAAKHSGADEVVVTISRSDEGVRMTVSDRGVGMQGDVRHTGTGVRHSILARAREVGIRAVIDSTPGQGTTVVLDHAFDDTTEDRRYRTGRDAPDPAAKTVEDLVRQLRWRSVYALSAGLVGVGMALAALNHPGKATPEWLMAAVVAIACGLAWRERERPRLSVATVLALSVAGPVAFALSAWSVGFGRIDPTLWQAVAPTGPLLVLLIVPLPRTVKTLGVGAYGLTVGVTAAAVAPASLEAASVTGLAGLVGLGLVVSVLSFIRSLATVATRANRERHEAFTVGLELAAVEAAGETRRRWRAAGLEAPVELLRAIGNGQLDPRDRAIRQQCAEEEAFLRQLSLLSPGLTQMGTWFARALNAARQRGVGLTVRAGAVDATVDDADQFGRMLLTAVEAMPAGTKLTTAFLATTKGLTMTLVAPTPHLITLLNDVRHRANVVTLQTLGTQDLAEIAAAGVDS